MIVDILIGLVLLYSSFGLIAAICPVVFVYQSIIKNKMPASITREEMEEVKDKIDYIRDSLSILPVPLAALAATMIVVWLAALEYFTWWRDPRGALETANIMLWGKYKEINFD